MDYDTNTGLSDEQAAFVGRELARHLNAGATIKMNSNKCLFHINGQFIFGGLIIEYPESSRPTHERE